MEIERKWAMPDKRTFDIKPIRKLIERHSCMIETWIDPFPYPFKKDALEYLSEFKDNSVEGILFDPPYSPRQLKECYDEMGETLTDTKSSVWSKWKDEIARVIQPGGKCISFGWNTNGLGKNRGFEIIYILLVAHGGNHNDTICTVEKKVNKMLTGETVFPSEDIIIAKSDKSSAEDLPSPETAVSASPKGGLS